MGAKSALTYITQSGSRPLAVKMAVTHHFRDRYGALMAPLVLSPPPRAGEEVRGPAESWPDSRGEGRDPGAMATVAAAYLLRARPDARGGQAAGGTGLAGPTLSPSYRSEVRSDGRGIASPAVRAAFVQ